MKAEFDIHYFNPEIHKDINSSKDNSSIQNASMAPFLNEDRNKKNKKTLEKEELTKKHKKLMEIVNEDEMKKFMAECLILNFLIILLFTFEFIDSFMDIGSFVPSILCMFRYIFAMSNLILCLDFLIVQSEYQNNRKKMELEMINNKQKLQRLPPADSNHFVYLNGPNVILGKVYRNKFSMFILKHINYLIYMITQTKVDNKNYISLFLMVIEYWQYNMCQFYYKTTLRYEFIKAKLDRLENMQ